MATPPTDHGLCDSCRHQQLICNTRGSTFSLCLLSRSDPRYRKYPRVPVLECRGHERADRVPDDASPPER